MSATNRAVCWAQLTKLCNSAEELIKSSGTDDNSAQALNIMKMRIKNAHEKLLAADKIHENAISADDLQQECELMIEYDDKAVTILAKIDFELQKIALPTTLQREISISQRTDNDEPNVSRRSEHGSIKLKQMELKKFDGHFENWLPFWEQFKKAVHENMELVFISKFNFLSASLVGRAAESITGFLPTEQCYNEAINLLNEEFGNNEKIIERYIQKLLTIKSVNSSKDVVGLRRLYNETQSTIRSLSALAVEPTQYEIMAKSILLQALPANLRVDYIKTKKRTQTSIEHSIDSEVNSLLKFLQNEVESLEISNLSENNAKRDNDHQNKKEPDSFNKLKRKGNGTAVGLYTSTKAEVKNCLSCKSTNHKTHMCTEKINLNEKKEILKKEGRCFRCANRNHMSKFCKALWIKCNICSGRHITALCENKKNEVIGAVEKTVNTTLSAIELAQNGTYLQTIKAIIEGENNKILTRCVMDNGSQRSYVSEKIVKNLNLPIVGIEKTCILAFGENNKNKKLSHSKRVQLRLKSQYSDEIILIDATVVPSICADVLPVPIIKGREFENINSKLADKTVSNESLVEGINLLIGQDHIWKLNCNKSKIIGNNLMAHKTVFGWTIQGCYNSNENVLYVFNVVEHEKFDITQFWSLESIGISTNNNVVGTTFSTIKFENNRYVVTLPWNNLESELKSNMNVAKNRLYALVNKLLVNNKINEYHNGMQDMLQNDIAEVVPENEISDKIYYMPHRPVYKEDSLTTKMRIVFDASSSEVDCLSLNEHLSIGENFYANLMVILLNFRCKNIAITADIEKAFLQILIDKKDRDAQRFFWFEKLPEANKKLPKMIEYRMKRVTFGVAASPYLLTATIKKHLLEHSGKWPIVCEILKDSFYVDDLVVSVDTVQQGLELYEVSKKLMLNGGFKLRKWNSNNTELNSNFMKHGETKQPDNQKVLGLHWNVNTDQLNINFEGSVKVIQSLTATKRHVMQAMGKVYDPLGLLGPFTVNLKILLQQIWKENIDWDEILPEKFKKEFFRWKNDLCLLEKFSINRCLTSRTDSEMQLHLFADASPQAYGVVAYLREVFKSGEVNINLICSKNRVSPIDKTSSNELSLPKLELTAALMAARLAKFILENMTLKFDKVNLWTDSSIALYWIVGNKVKRNLQRYVQGRVNEINKLTNIYNWKHCNGKQNPADLLTRGVSGEQFMNAEVWKNGPLWFKDAESLWPKFKFEITMNTVEEDFNEITQIEPIYDITNVSSLKRILRITAYVFRFIQKMKNKRLQFNDELTTAEINEAEHYWVKLQQQIYFKTEIDALKANKELPRSSKILCLNPVLVNDVLRLQSRLNTSNNTSEQRSPIILPKHSKFSKLIITEAHQSLFHSGTNAVLTQVRKKYWIVQGRQLIKGVLNKCVICKRLHGKNANEIWTVLPLERTNTSRPFETTGINFAGPLFIKLNNDPNLKKVYIMLFTCAAIRAVHLELVMDMTVQSCINGIKRFIARRGIPKIIMSDNAKTFKRAELEINKLKSLIKQNEMQRQLTVLQLNWKYIPERAAWWGGFWERLIKIVKTCLKSAIGKQILTLDEISTLLAEVEGVVNSRPLTYVSNDAKDLEPLTPSHFLNAHCALNFDFEFVHSSSSMLQLWKYRQALMKQFFKRWRQEYLHQLRSIHHNKCGPVRSVSEGDVVLLEDDNKPRLYWKLATVHKTYPGRDGRVRACDLYLGSGKYVKRPIQLLYPLEISSAIAGRENVKN